MTAPRATPLDGLRIAAIIPCYNEEVAVAKVVQDVREALPTADIYVYDNKSTDRTAEVARAAGAIVRTEESKGKGNVLRRAFADIDADVYVLTDGDDTYGTAQLPAMVSKLVSGPYDHVLGVREESGITAYRPGHSFGNRAFNRIVSWLFRQHVSDMLSGCRVMSRRFVKSFPLLSREFEIETEMTIHYCSLRIPNAEMPVEFRERPEGSSSKLHTFRDGFKILRLITNLVRHEKPIAFHTVLGTILWVMALIIGLPVVFEFAQTGYVERLPSAVLASSIAVLGFVAWIMGLALEAVTRSRHENARLAYLGLEPLMPPKN